MTRMSTWLGAFSLMAFTLPTTAAAQQAVFDLHPELTAEEFEEFAGELGSILRFRQLGDTAPLGRGTVEIGLQSARTSIDDAKAAWTNTVSRPFGDHRLGALSFPRIVARFGVTDRVDIGAWGGINTSSKFGVIGVDTSIALLSQDRGRPLTLSLRPSLTTLVGPIEVWAANASLDLSVSRAFGNLSPYAGLATMASGAYERSDEVDLEPATAESSLVYAGVAYRWKTLVLAAEVEKGELVSYGFRIGTRF